MCIRDSNALCAVALAHLFGVSIDDAAASLAHTYVRGRFEIVKTPLDAVFILDYAHNGLSLESALTTLRAYAPHRLVCVLGSVGGRTEGRRAELGKVVSEQADMVILTADNPDFEDPAAICAAIRDAFVREIPTEIIPDRAEAVRATPWNMRARAILCCLRARGMNSISLCAAANCRSPSGG